jgi:hypothetical protein
MAGVAGIKSPSELHGLIAGRPGVWGVGCLAITAYVIAFCVLRFAFRILWLIFYRLSAGAAVHGHGHARTWDCSPCRLPSVPPNRTHHEMQHRPSSSSSSRGPPSPPTGHTLGRISWLRRVRLENPLGHGNFMSGLKLSGERDGGLGLARFSAGCPLGGHMYANGL